LLARAEGNILEIGFGTGLNLPHYPTTVRRITTIDPNINLRRRIQKRVEQSGIEVDQNAGSVERLPFADGTFDCVVSTLTLCSLGNVGRALSEVFRVLRLGGRFLFLELGLSPAPVVQKWQRRLNRIQMWLSDGCRLDRDIKGLIAAQPFRSIEVAEFDLEKTFRIHGHMPAPGQPSARGGVLQPGTGRQSDRSGLVSGVTLPAGPGQ
jgi:SAM-dependent methyltransferase